MAKQIINIGSVADDGTGSTIRAGGSIINDNFNEVYTLLGNGTTLHSLTFPNVTDTIVTKNTTDILTNKTINASNNTFSNIPNSALTNNSITINGSPVSLGGSTTITTASSLTVVDNSSTSATISLNTDTLSILGGTGLSSTVSGDTITLDIDNTVATLTGTQSLTNKTLTSPVLGGTTISASGNIVFKPATNTLEIQGDGSTTGQIQLNCPVNTHGQKIASQPHAQGATNTLTLPGGSTIGDADAVLVSNTGTQSLTNKTIGVTQLVGNTRTATGDGSTVAFTVTNGTTTNNTLVFISGAITTDYTISSTTLTFGTPPAGAAAIVIKEL
jgi:hypothetical protein